MNRCEICRGARVIRLPLYKEMTAVPMDNSSTSSNADFVKTFPCPECGETVPFERVAIIRHTSEVITHRHDKDFVEYSKQSAASQLLAFLVDKDAIDFEWGPVDTLRLTQPLRATLAVVSKTHVASMEDRIFARQGAIASKLVEAAIRGITNWNSQYVGPSGHIQKSVAISEIMEALRLTLGSIPAVRIGE